MKITFVPVLFATTLLPAAGLAAPNPANKTTQTLPPPVTYGLNHILPQQPKIGPAFKAGPVRPGPQLISLPPPTDVKATNVHGDIVITWSPPATAQKVHGYKVYRSNSGKDAYSLISKDEVSADKLTFTDPTSPVGGVTYDYVVTATYQTTDENGKVSEVESEKSALAEVLADGKASSDFLFTPGYSTSDSGSSWGTSFEYDYNTPAGIASTSLIASYNNASPKSAGSYEDDSIEVDTHITPSREPVTTVVSLNYDEAQGHSHTTSIGTSFTGTISSITASGSVTYVKSTAVGGGDSSGFEPSITLTTPASPNVTLIGVYIPNNKVINESSYTFGFNLTAPTLNNVALRVLYGKHNSFGATLQITF